MAKVDDKVMAVVENALKKNPDTSNDELFQLAKGVNSSVGKLSKRQFHARYPLQVKRKASPTKGSRKAKPRKAAAPKPGKKAAASQNGSARDSVRGIILRFASDLAGADDRKDVVKVVASVDRYVDEVLKAAGNA